MANDRWLDSGLVMSQCDCCAHRTGRHGNIPTCRAYPQAVPPAIRQNRHDHRAVHDGDGGVVFRLHPHMVDAYRDLCRRLGWPLPEDGDGGGDAA